MECRICRARGALLYKVEKKALLYFYLSLTKYKFNTTDSRSKLVCRRCIYDLLRCHRLLELCLKSERAYDQTSHTVNRFTHLTVAPVKTVNIQPKEDIIYYVKDEDATVDHGGLVEVPSPPLQNQPDIEQENEPESLLETLFYMNVCTTCSKEFKSSDAFERHKKTHKTFRCDTCNNIYQKKKDLLNHKRTHIRKQSSSICNVCDKVVSKKSYSNHMKTHREKQKFACEICDKQFITKYSLNRHKRTHTVEEAIACNICDKQFRLKRYLDVHMRIHTKDTSHVTHTPQAKGLPFACKLCVRKFKRKCTFVAHMKTHTESKLFACRVLVEKM